MATYKTPGVYIEEVSTFPPSVAEVSTAIPAFIGYTARGPKVARISTLLEYETLFGVANPQQFEIKTKIDPATESEIIDQVSRVTSSSSVEFLMYYSISLYFKNGGGACYIFSVGDYQDTVSKGHFSEGLALLEKEDEPTLLVFPDAINLVTKKEDGTIESTDYYSLCQDALAQSNKLGDRFAILDVLDTGVPGEDAKDFRDNLSTPYPLYGAAYYPYIQTSLNYHYKENGISIVDTTGTSGGPLWQKSFGETGNGIIVKNTSGDEVTPSVKILKGTKNGPAFEISNNGLTISEVGEKTGQEVVAAWKNSDSPDAPFDIEIQGEGSDTILHTSGTVPLEQITLDEISEDITITLDKISSTKTALYNQIKTALNSERVILPPSPAIAGIYARVDRDRGVWKSPANESLSSVIGPLVKITHEEQEDLNVDTEAGKSINAIRQFTGKGTLVWGARTLAGNDNEWRYVSVRRLFNLIEESSKKASAFAVFEPNDASTWLKVKAMIESYLYGLWEQGALAGPTSEAAYYVQVGLGKTMTTDDVLNGRMIIEIGIAAVRPAEFIIIRFSHKLQEA